MNRKHLLTIVLVLVSVASYLFFIYQDITTPDLPPKIVNTDYAKPQEPVISKPVQYFNPSVDTANWVRHSGQGFFKFSIKTPLESVVCLGETATGGNDGGCYPEGVLLKSEDFPYGISFEQTYLEPDLETLVGTFGYEGYQTSDLKILGAENQIMLLGEETKTFYESSNKSITAKVKYIKYLFTHGNDIYMPKIYTNPENENLDLYKEILNTWRFED